MSRYKVINDIDVADDFKLPEGNVLRGQLLFKKHCSQCHTIRKDGLNPYGTLWGPNLYGVMGRTAAQNQRSGGSKYSQSLEASGILWTERNMMAFLKNPRAFAGGAINMNFRGIDSFRDRVDLVHYLRRAGHESWMVQDGTPHSQKRWWARGKEGQGQSYWQAHVDEKQLKPWQHVQRAAAGKLESYREEAYAWLGWNSTPAAASSGAAKHAAAEDLEARTWRQVSGVVDGVRPASMQQSFNWPPPEVITEGPVKKQPAPSARAASSASAGQQAAPSSLPGGTRLPSGLIVYCDQGGPAAGPAAPARTPATPPPPAPIGAVRPDGGRVAPSGLIVYREPP